VAAGPAPGRLFPQLSQQNSIVTVCQTAPAAGAPWRSDGADIARTLSAYIAWQRRAEDASGGNLTEFANRPGRRHEKAVQAAFAIIIRGWFARRVRLALWFRAPSAAWSAGRQRGWLVAHSATAAGWRCPARPRPA